MKTKTAKKTAPKTKKTPTVTTVLKDAERAPTLVHIVLCDMEYDGLRLSSSVAFAKRKDAERLAAEYNGDGGGRDTYEVYTFEVQNGV